MIFFLQLLWEAQEDGDPWWPLSVSLAFSDSGYVPASVTGVEFLRVCLCVYRCVCYFCTPTVMVSTLIGALI